jgi:Ni,Fe-hydrogenase III small subunit
VADIQGGLFMVGMNSRSLGLKKTYKAVPDLKIAITIEVCVISGGPFIDYP